MAGDTRRLGTRPHTPRRAVQGVHSVAYSPLGHRKDNELMTHPVLLEVAAEAGKSPAQVGRAGGSRGWPAGQLVGSLADCLVGRAGGPLQQWAEPSVAGCWQDSLGLLETASQAAGASWLPLLPLCRSS